MDLDDDMLYDNDDSGNEFGEDDDVDFVEMGMEAEPCSTHEKRELDEFPYEILTPDKIVAHMVECIKEVNAVVEVIITISTVLSSNVGLIFSS